MKKKMIRRIASFVLCALILMNAISVCAVEGTSIPYTHDPRLCNRAMEESVIDPTAVYGFSPRPNGNLSTYERFDWTDPEEVETLREERLTYLESYQEMDRLLSEMAGDGKSTEEIARAVSAKRNEIRLAAYADDPEALAAVKERNLEKYGHEEGPLPDELFVKYGSWEKVMEKAFALSPGEDVCVGLYDDYYDYYVAFGYVEDEQFAAATREYAVARFAESAGLPQGGSLDAFSDAESVSPWYRDSLASAVSNGVMKGYEDGTLRPKNTISRVEAMVILSRCLPSLEATGEAIDFSDVPAWAKADIDRLSSAGIVKGYGDGRLGATDDLTVEQVQLLVSRLNK